MKFTGNRQRLLDAFRIVGSVASSRNVRPMLQNLRLLVGPDGATLLATDLEVAIRYRVPLDTVEEPGDVVIHAGRVQQLLAEATTDKVTFESTSKDRGVRLIAGRSKFTVHGENPDDFPVIQSFGDRKSVSFARDAFVRMVDRTHFAAAKDRTRFAFNGCMVHVNGSVVQMVGTDGKRLACATASCDNPDGATAKHILPIKGLLTFVRVLVEEDATLAMAFEEKQVMLKTSRAEVMTLLVEGSYPDHNQVIPKDWKISVTMKREDFVRGLRQAKLLVPSDHPSVRLSLGENSVGLSARSTDVGDAQIEIDAVVEGGVLDVAFNPEYVLEGLNAMTSDQVILHLNDPQKPARLDGEKDFVYVVMPVTMRAG
jgi:DNA polymerase-3 subunit beta